MAADTICDDLRIEPAWIVETGSVDHYQFRHRGKCQVNWSSAGGAEGVYLFISAVARNPPAFGLAHDCHIGALRERQIGSMPGAAAFLAIAALAVILKIGSPAVS